MHSLNDCLQGISVDDCSYFRSERHDDGALIGADIYVTELSKSDALYIKEMDKNRNETKNAITSGKTILGIEFGSTRIKAALSGKDHTPIASGSHDWENRYEDGVWTYHREDVWIGLQESYQELRNGVLEK